MDTENLTAGTETQKFRVNRNKKFRVKRSTHIEQKLAASTKKNNGKNGKPEKTIVSAEIEQQLAKWGLKYDGNILSLESIFENIQVLNDRVAQLEDKLKWVSA